MRSFKVAEICVSQIAAEIYRYNWQRKGAETINAPQDGGKRGG